MGVEYAEPRNDGPLNNNTWKVKDLAVAGRAR